MIAFKINIQRHFAADIESIEIVFVNNSNDAISAIAEIENRSQITIPNALGRVWLSTNRKIKNYLEKYERVITVEDVLDNKKDLSTLELNEANTLIDKIADSDEFKNKMDDERSHNLAKFVYNISAELAMKAWEKFTLVNPDSVTSMWEKVVDTQENLTFGNYIAKIAGSVQD